MILENTDSITFFASGSTLTSELQFVVSYNEISTIGLLPLRNTGEGSGATNFTIVSSPSLGLKRQVTEMSIYNPQPNTGSTIYINLYNGSQYYTLFSAQLQDKETLQFFRKISTTLS